MDLSNAELQICFENYHRALHDESYRDPGEKVLTVKCSNGKNLKVLVEPSFTIYYVKLNIEYAYGRNIYPLEQQILTKGEVVLDNEVTLMETMIFDDGYLLLDMKSEEFGSEEFKERKETATAEENGEKNDDVLVEKGKEKAPVMELTKKSNLVSEIAKQAGEIQKFPIQEEVVASDVAKLKEAEDGYTVSTVIDSHNLRMNPHSVLPRSGSSVLSFNVVMVPNLFLDDAAERDYLVYRSYIALGSCQLVINKIDDYVASPLQLVKLLALYLSSPDNKESTISSLKEWLAVSAIANNSILRLIGGIIFMHEHDYNEALKHNYLIFIFSSCQNSSRRHIEGNFEIHVIFYTFLVIVGGGEWEIRRGLQISVDMTLAPHLLDVFPLKVFFAPFDRGRSWDDGILSGISREICEYCNDGDEVYCDKGIAFTFNDVDADGISCVQLTLCGKTFLGLIRDHLKCKNFIVGAVHLLLSQFTWHVSLSNVGGKWDEGVSSAPQLLDILPLKGVFEWYEMNLPQPWELIEEQILWPFDREKKKEMGLNVVSLQYTFGNVCLFGYEVEAFKKWRERLKATDQCMPPLVLVDVIGKLGVMFDI